MSQYYKVLNFMHKEVELTRTQREKIREFIGPDIEAHRVVRGSAGGKYVLSNIMWVPKETHKALHQGERMGRKG